MKDAPPPFGAGELPPKRVAWLHPFQLLRTAYHVWLSTTAKEYIDRRETLAALDQIPVRRAAYPVSSLVPTNTYDAELPQRFVQQGVWLDFVADIGDSWSATYAVSRLVATRDLKVHGHAATLPAASCVVIGGDLVYPTPSRDRYRLRTRSALIGARPGSADGAPAPSLLVIPGNHDWYDGLTNFVREFCQGGAIGGWYLAQRRSYFAVRLTEGWWLWGIDIALDTRIDPPQQAYFLSILSGERGEPGRTFREHDNIILCTAKPAWLDQGEALATEAKRNLSYFVQEIVEKNRGCVRVILSGDLHHYSRYEDRRGDQLITAGGGGAYLSGTHQLPDQVPGFGPSPKPDDAFRAAPFPYPSRSDSRWLALGGLLLALRKANWPFAAFVGFVYWLFVWTLMQAHKGLLTGARRELLWVPVDLALSPSATFAYFVAAAVLASTVMLAAAGNRATWRLLTVAWGLVHGFAHMVLALLVGWQLEHWPRLDYLASLLPFERAAAQVFAASLMALGGLAGATVVGVYLVVSDMLFGWHTNQVFAAQSIMNYRNFVRIFVDPGGTLTIYPIGLRRIPRKWRYARERNDHEPYYEPTDLVLQPHLIEGPLTVTPRDRPRPVA